MKTPREILLKRHQSVEPKLDRMWAENLTTELHSSATPARENVFLTAVLTLWRELFLPSRRIWAGLACAWRVGASPHDRAEQRQMLAQLIGPLAEPTYTQKRTAPGPRSDRAAQTSVA